MSSDLRTYGFGATLLAVPVALTATAVIPPSFCNAMTIKHQAGGSLAIVSAASGITAANGFLLGSSGPALSISGPAVFYLNAAGSTSTAAILFHLSAGYSATVG